MSNPLSISNRSIAFLMAMIIPFCCCTLNLCAQSADSEVVSSCCCNNTENSCPSDEQVPNGNCSWCVKAPANTAPNLDIDSLSQLPVLHPAEIAVSAIGLLHKNAGLQCDWYLPDDRESNPDFSARALRRQITLQV